MTVHKKMILTADDFGMSPKFNEAILELVHECYVSGTSVMIKRKFLRKDVFDGRKNIALGLHLELKKQDSLHEIELQLSLFQKKFGRFPDYIDGHKHHHLTPENIPGVINVAKKYSLPVRSVSDWDRALLKKNGIKTSDSFISWHPSRTKKLLGALSAVQGTAELVCHPGYYDKKSTYPYNKEREEELTFLKSKRFRRAIEKFHLINYRDL